MPQHTSPLESLRARWQGAAEALCSSRGLSPSLLGVVVSDVLADAGGGNGGASAAELPPGVHQFRQVQEWLASTAAQAQRSV